MFSNKKAETNQPAQGQAPSPNSSNSIVGGTVIEGNVKANSDMRLDGELIGNISCTGKLIIGPEGRIIGDITCQNAVIEGVFEGKMVCSELLNVRENAKIKGHITTDKLIVQSGATFNVTCVMGDEARMRNGK
jgi:cytoskeletal protein CcmA (bactofilin family)